MNWYKNLRVKSKLLISFIIIIVFVVALAVLAYVTVNNLDKDYTYLLEYPEKRLQYLSELDSNLIDIRRTTSTLSLFAENTESINNYWGQFEEAYDKAQDNINKYLESNNNDKVREASTLQKNSEIVQGIKKQLESYKQLSDRAVAIAQETHNPSATSAVFLTGVSIITEIQETSGQLVNSAKDYMNQISEENTKSKDASVRLFVIIAIVIVVLSIVIALLVSAMISKPLLKVSGMMDQVGNSGSLVFSEETKRVLEKEAMGKDEIAQTISSSVKTIQHFEKISQILQQVADGDLTAELAVLSENDTMGLSLRKMIDNLNVMFGEIHVSTIQVATASKQIADGAQSLAQGSTEQASAVEQLSVSINEVAYKTSQNAGIAREASELSSTIMGNAEKGAGQMEQMMQAVQEINEASNQIKKVIKVIDDIAFQTNILALNAAVEAARAGQHGKGFAVVAEEVRNLAAKSANAAKETGGLIENSVEKANFGLNIAQETSASLKDIVEGINRSADIVLQIAQSSDEQAGAITQINTGIDQVAQVVQQNSATAEESAAASEEMSSQTDMLEQMILRFKLKDSHKGPAKSPVYKQLTMPGKNSYSLYDDEDGGFGKY